LTGFPKNELAILILGKPRQVFASVLRPEHSDSKLSNRFAFSFSVDPTGGLLPAVRPARTGEAIAQLKTLEASQNIPDWDM
jgi:hypothetical protein